MKPNLGDALRELVGTLDSLDLKQPALILLDSREEGDRWLDELQKQSSALDYDALALPPACEMRFLDVLIRWPAPDDR
jgi:hypothetical protein